MNGIGGRLGDFNPYYQRRMTQKPAAEEPKKDVKPQGNESTQPKREETKYYEQGEDGNLKLIKEENDGYGDRRQILHNSDGTTIERTELRDGAILLEKKDKNGNLIGREVKRF